MKKEGTKNLSFTQRLQIETLFNNNVPKQQIADYVGIHIRTLYYELKRGEYKKKVRHRVPGYKAYFYYKTSYSAQIAHDRYKVNCTAKGRPIKLGNDFEFVNYVRRRVIKDRISPCAVLGQIKRNNIPFKTNISKTTLYRYIDLGLFDGIRLQRRLAPSKRVTCIKRAPKGTSIEQRPLEVKMRNTFGHWEMDCLCGPTKTSFLVLTERLTRKELIFKMDSQKANNVVACIDLLERRYGKLFPKVFKTITVDNGAEFSDYKGIEHSKLFPGERTKVYYCHPYCSSERGTNERLNREIRKLIPKGTNLATYKEPDVAFVEKWINDYPRSIFSYSTSEELFRSQLSRLTA